MGMSIKIRPYQTKDQAEVIRLLANLQDHVARIDPFHRLRRKDEFNAKRYFLNLQKVIIKSGRIFLAEQNEQVVGLVAAAVTSTTLSDLEVRPGLGYSGRVFELIVDKEVRGLGVGKKLVKAAEQFLREKKCGIIFIGCFATNTKTLEFYRSQGYVERSIEFAKRIRAE